MAKKKNKNKKMSAYKEFVSALKENQKKIYVMNGEEKVSLGEAVDNSVMNITAVPVDGIIPVTSEDAAKKRDMNTIQVDCRYAKSAFSLYEYAMKYHKTRQTLVLTLSEDEIINLFDFNMHDTITTLMERTNISLILKKMDKTKNRLRKWLDRDSDEDCEMFILNIPDVVLFTNVLKKKEVSTSVFFNLTIQVVKTKKNFEKMKKKDSDTFAEIMKTVKENTLKVAKDLGNASIHLEVSETFMNDVNEAANQWFEIITGDETNQKLFNKIIFSTDNSNNLVAFANEIVNKVMSMKL